jgi:hypothetical protein
VFLHGILAQRQYDGDKIGEDRASQRIEDHNEQLQTYLTAQLYTPSTVLVNVFCGRRAKKPPPLAFHFTGACTTTILHFSLIRMVK